MYAILCYGLWGLTPIYWKLLKIIDVFDLGAHRVVWTFVFVLTILLLRRSYLWLKTLHFKLILKVFCASLLITFNWVCFIWAVNSDKILLASLGYYMNPLVNVTLGRVFLQERLTQMQKLSLVLAVIAVMILTYKVGELPWISLGLAISFGLYGLVKKSIPLGSIQGLGVESAFILPFAVFYLSQYSSPEVSTYLFVDKEITGLLLLGGIVTALPLIWFNSAAQRLRLSTLGFFQYLAPSISVLIAIFIYNESFSLPYKFAFSLIWAALILFILDNLRVRMSRTP